MRTRETDGLIKDCGRAGDGSVDQALWWTRRAWRTDGQDDVRTLLLNEKRNERRAGEAGAGARRIGSINKKPIKRRIETVLNMLPFVCGSIFPRGSVLCDVCSYPNGSASNIDERLFNLHGCDDTHHHTKTPSRCIDSISRSRSRWRCWCW